MGERLFVGGATACVALLATSAQAQIAPVSRLSHLVSDYSSYDWEGGHNTHNEGTLTDWISGDNRYGAAHEILTLAPGLISVNVVAGGTAHDNPMQQTGDSLSSSYSGEFIFDLGAACTFNLSGQLSVGLGNASLAFFDMTRGVTIFNAPAPHSLSLNPYSFAGSLDAGRYRLTMVAQGVPAGGGGPGDADPTAVLSIVPAPGVLSLAGLAGLASLRRRR